MVIRHKLRSIKLLDAAEPLIYAVSNPNRNSSILLIFSPDTASYQTHSFTNETILKTHYIQYIPYYKRFQQTFPRILHQLFLICEIVNVIINENKDNRRDSSVKNKLDSLFFARLFVSEQKQIASMTRHKKTCLREFEILVASSQQVAQK